MRGTLLASVPQGASDKRELKPLPAPSTILNVKMESTFHLTLFKSRQCLPLLGEWGNEITHNSVYNFVSHKKINL